MRSPLLSIRISRSDCSSLHAGQHFDTISDFDATLRAVRRRRAEGGASVVRDSGRVHFVITWKDGATFHGRYELDGAGGDEGLVELVIAACRDVLREPRLDVLLDGARLTVLRLFDAASAELHRAVIQRPAATEASCSRP